MKQQNGRYLLVSYKGIENHMFQALTVSDAGQEAAAHSMDNSCLLHFVMSRAIS